ncbi:hypothetical protein KAI12_00075 [Candidatus Bathyarchaeota archaeon]|nr:hypothetical protein [Candidatus Bathyarchaeota archaeon]
MIKRIGEYRRYVGIIGFRNVKIKDIEDFIKRVRREKAAYTSVQFFDASLVATWEHLYFAVLNSLAAFKNGLSISKNLEMEILLYASAQRQIEKAIKRIGIKQENPDVAVVIVGEKLQSITHASLEISRELGLRPTEAVLELSTEKIQKIQQAFAVTEKELETVMKRDNLGRTLVDLVIERMALLSTKL